MMELGMHGFREGSMGWFALALRHISYLLKSGSTLVGHYWSQHCTYGEWDIWIEGEGYLLLFGYPPFK
jgi:hypothetical protein